jgi:hypothetical protein
VKGSRGLKASVREMTPKMKGTGKMIKWVAIICYIMLYDAIGSYYTTDVYNDGDPMM